MTTTIKILNEGPGIIEVSQANMTIPAPYKVLQPGEFLTDYVYDGKSLFITELQKKPAE